MTEIRQVLESPSCSACAAKCCTLDQGYVRRIYERAKTSICRRSSSAPGHPAFAGHRASARRRAAQDRPAVPRAAEPDLTASAFAVKTPENRPSTILGGYEKPAPATFTGTINRISAATCRSGKSDLHRPSGRLHHHGAEADNLELARHQHTATIRIWVISTGDAPTSAALLRQGAERLLGSQAVSSLDEAHLPSLSVVPPEAQVEPVQQARVRPIQGVANRFGDKRDLGRRKGLSGENPSSSSPTLHPQKTFAFIESLCAGIAKNGKASNTGLFAIGEKPRPDKRGSGRWRHSSFCPPAVFFRLRLPPARGERRRLARPAGGISRDIPDHIAVDGQRVRKTRRRDLVDRMFHSSASGGSAAHPDPRSGSTQKTRLLHMGRVMLKTRASAALPLAPGYFTGIPLGKVPDLETL